MPPLRPSPPPLTPSPLTVEGIREMGDDMAVKLNKYHKPRLIEAIVVCMARIDLLEASNIRSDSNVRAELRELEAAVFANVSNAVITQDTQDVLDRPNVGWDNIHKLTRGASWHKEQNPAPPTTPQPQPHAQQTPSQLALRDAKLAKLTYVKATRIAQERTQEAAQEAERIRQDDTADLRKAKKEERYGAKMERLGKLPPCPKIVTGEECSGISCEEEELGFPYEHLDNMVVCQDKAHLTVATKDGCLLFHLWPARKKRSPKPPPGPPAKNSGGGTSGARQAPQNRGIPRAGKPRHAGKGTQQQQQQQQPRGQQQQQCDMDHRQFVIERLNLELEVARTNAGVRTNGRECREGSFHVTRS
jgi:hypothetical protein